MKRKRSNCKGDRPLKRLGEASSQSTLATHSGVEHPVLRRLYTEVSSLRHYLLSRLPTSSKNRRRKISQLGLSTPSHDANATRGVDFELGYLLDSTLVGVPPNAPAAARNENAKERDGDIESFSQQLPECATASTFKPGYFLQSEVRHAPFNLHGRTSMQLESKA